MTGNESESVLYGEPSPGVRLITINRPEARNAIGPVESRALFEFLGRFRDDEEANVLVVTGAGTEAFCAGADLKSVVAMFDPDSKLEPLYDGSDLDAHPIPAEGNIGPTRWTSINKPIIAAVNGAAYAGGLEWACLAHLRVADQHASFGVTCRRWNVGLGDGGTQRLPRMIGLSRALDLIITGRVVGAAEAERIGLVNEVTESGRCLERALELAAEISALPQPALRTDLEAALRGFGTPLEEGLAIEAGLFNSLLDQPEIMSGASAFVDRDHPDRVAGAAPLHLPGAAYAFAERAHRGQIDRHGGGDFIEHPSRVARIAVEHGGDFWPRTTSRRPPPISTTRLRKRTRPRRKSKPPSAPRCVIWSKRLDRTPESGTGPAAGPTTATGLRSPARPRGSFISPTGLPGSKR